MLVISLCSRNQKTKKTPPPKQKKFMLSRVSRTLQCAAKRVKGIHIPHQFYNTKYIPCESKKIPLKLAFVVLFFRNNLVNLLCESTVKYNRGYSKTLSTFRIFFFSGISAGKSI